MSKIVATIDFEFTANSSILKSTASLQKPIKKSFTWNDIQQGCQRPGKSWNFEAVLENPGKPWNLWHKLKTSWNSRIL